MRQFSRRDILKLAALAPAALAFSQTIVPGLPGGSAPNIIVLVFDAMSADNLSLYGYPRRTSPNLERLAQRSTVYHSHDSAGNFTSPGTASLLTGLYPWTHRAINFNGQVAPAFAQRNIFALFGRSYDRIGFGQNLLAEFLLSEFRSGLDVHLPPASFSARAQLLGTSFKNDTPVSYYALDDFFFRPSATPRSLVVGLMEHALLGFRLESLSTVGYHNGIPRTNNKIYYRLEDIFRGLTSQVRQFQRPFLAYFHIWSPHAPYLPSAKFEDRFA
ncbi:MAG TPA: sulfatase-like hydrolase/transferase, partial [Anaerolineales bacterium]|nr:sulfatase-like hydrolase/transferase [Anaerolineales bacterium]